MKKSIFLNIGSNRGDRSSHIERAVALIAQRWPEALLRRAPIEHSEPWGYASDAEFLNLGIALDFADSDLPAPYDVLDAVQNIETQVSADSPHRNADGTYCDRDIDIDIIDIDGVTLDDERLTIPHPRAEARTFVMRPMQFLRPGWSPVRTDGRHLKKSIADMARADIDTFRAQAKTPVVVVLDNVRSLNNIGSIFRTADGFALSGVVLCGISATPPHPDIHKTALGAEQSVDWQYFANTTDAVRKLRDEGYTICCLEQVHGSVSLEQFIPDANNRYALIVGNEVAGVDQAIVADCDLWLEIPQAGTKHSLNVAVSTAITLWHFFSHLNVSTK